MFAFVDATLVHPLPYRQLASLVALFESLPVGDRYHLSFGDFQDWQRSNRTLSALHDYRPERATLKHRMGLKLNDVDSCLSFADFDSGFEQTTGTSATPISSRYSRTYVLETAGNDGRA